MFEKKKSYDVPNGPTVLEQMRSLYPKEALVLSVTTVGEWFWEWHKNHTVHLGHTTRHAYGNSINCHFNRVLGQQENCFMFFMTAKDSSDILPSEYENIKHTTWTRYIDMSTEKTSVFDYILFDLPPAMTDEVKQIIHHSGLVYVPTMLGEFEIAGLEKVTVEIAMQQARLGGNFVTMYQKENDAALLAEFQALLQSQMMRTVIPYSRTVRESLKVGLPIEEYFIDRKVPRSPSSWKIVDAYDSLAAEIMDRFRKVDTPVTF